MGEERVQSTATGGSTWGTLLLATWASGAVLGTATAHPSWIPVHPRSVGRLLTSATQAPQAELQRALPARPGVQRAPAIATAADEIDALYAELATLNPVRATSAAYEERFQRLLQRLRQLQAEEAEQLRVSFEQGLKSPLGAGRALLSRVEELLAKHEDPPGSPPSSGSPHRT